ncbi:MAG: hypothetical protein JSW68_03365, partial [Burkholderiales bacterium]
MALDYATVKAQLDAVSAETGDKFVPFDAGYYVSRYGDWEWPEGSGQTLAGFSGDPLQHYVEVGAGAGFMPNAWFDASFYRSQYPDVQVLGGADVLVHYAKFGVNEGRAPTASLVDFDGARYLRDNPDVLPYVEANLDDFGGSLSNGALAHYLKFGAGESRLAYDVSGDLIPFTTLPGTSEIAGVVDGDVTSVALNTNGGRTTLVGNDVEIDGTDA